MTVAHSTAHGRKWSISRQVKSLCLVLLTCGLTLVSVAQTQPPQKPLSKDDVIKLLAGSVSPRRVSELANERGVDFQVTPETENELRRVGADDALLSTLKHLHPKALVFITTVPGVAKVFIDGKLMGTTNANGELLISALQPGGHFILLSKDAYYDRGEAIVLKEGETLRISETLDASLVRSTQGQTAAADLSHGADVPSMPISSGPTTAPLSLAAVSEIVQRGKSFKAGGDYANAIQFFSRAAEQNDPSGEAELGMMYADGLGVERDFSRAATLMQKAAGQGYSRAQYRLGDFYYHGLGVSQDYLQALQWYQKAAYQGDKDAEKGLGIMYQYGFGVPKDEAQAAYWFKQADPAWLPSMPFITSPTYNSATTFKVSLIIGNVWSWTAHDGVLSVASSGIAYTETDDSRHNFTAACTDVVEVKGNSSAKLWAVGTFHIKVRGPEYNFLPAWWKSLPNDKNERKAFCNSEITSIIKAVTASCGTISR